MRIWVSILFALIEGLTNGAVEISLTVANAMDMLRPSDVDFCKFFDQFESKLIERTKINLIDNRKIDLSNK